MVPLSPHRSLALGACHRGPALLPRARDSASAIPFGSRGQPPCHLPTGRSMVMEELTEEPAELVERVAALEGLGGV